MISGTDNEKILLTNIIMQYRKMLDETTNNHFQQEWNDYQSRFKLIVKGTVSKNRPDSELKAEAEIARKLLSDYEIIKMDIQPNSIWYVISAAWFKNWKLYIGFDEMQGGDFPGMITNEDIIEFEEGRQVVCDDQNQNLNINLKDNLREDDHYVILSPEIWDFLSKRYGGRMIQRVGVKNENGDTSIEVYLTKVFTYFFPMSQDNQHIDVMYTSRYTTIEQIMS